MVEYQRVKYLKLYPLTDYEELVKALFFFRNEKQDDMRRERGEIMVPGKRTGGGTREG